MAPIPINNSTISSLTPWDSMNLLGGAAPFLALLGQDFTNRYLSLSHNCCDWFVFSVIPTGVPYAMRVLIRLLRLQKTKDGNFYTNYRKALEKDLLSTTSDEICEIWSGHQVKRVGKVAEDEPVIREYIYIPAREGTPAVLRPSKIAKYGNRYHGRKYKPWLQKGGGLPRGLESREHEETDEPPNLLLNLTPDKRACSMWLLCVLGIIFQAGIMVFAGFTAFHPRLISRFFDKSPRACRITAFICVELGTFLLFFGLLYAAKSLTFPLEVRRSTWKPPDGEKPKVVWVQQENKGDDWHTEAYILAKNVEAELLSAHTDSTASLNKSLYKSFYKSQFTYIAIVSIPAGFILQSIGLSMMHWAVQTWQFFALIVMFIGRWFVRRQVPPEYVLRLRDEWARTQILGILDSSEAKDEASESAIKQIAKDLRAGRDNGVIVRNTVQAIITKTGTLEQSIFDDISNVIKKISGKDILDEDIMQSVPAPPG